MLFTWRYTNPAWAMAAFEVPTPQDDIDVLSVPDRGFVNPRHPGRDGVASRNGVGNVRRIQGFGGAQEAIANLFHGPHHPFKGNFADHDLSLAQAHCFSRL